MHCYAGVSRSSSFVIGYLIGKYQLSFDQAKERVKKRRPCIHPGDGFIHHLKHYASVIAQRAQDKPNLDQRDSPQKELKNESVVLTERTRRGVRGAVRSAELKSTLIQQSKAGKKEEEKLEDGRPDESGEKREGREKRDPW